MPANHGVRLDDDKVVSPPRPEPKQHNPESAIHCCEPGLRPRLRVRCKLLPQGKLDYCLLIAASDECRAVAERQRNDEVEAYRAEILRDLFAETQTDSQVEVVVP